MPVPKRDAQKSIFYTPRDMSCDGLLSVHLHDGGECMYHVRSRAICLTYRKRAYIVAPDTLLGRGRNSARRATAEQNERLAGDHEWVSAGEGEGGAGCEKFGDLAAVDEGRRYVVARLAGYGAGFAAGQAQLLRLDFDDPGLALAAWAGGRVHVSTPWEETYRGSLSASDPGRIRLAEPWTLDGDLEMRKAEGGYVYEDRDEERSSVLGFVSRVVNDRTAEMCFLHDIQQSIRDTLGRIHRHHSHS